MADSKRWNLKSWISLGGAARLLKACRFVPILALSRGLATWVPIICADTPLNLWPELTATPFWLEGRPWFEQHHGGFRACRLKMPKGLLNPYRRFSGKLKWFFCLFRKKVGFSENDGHLRKRYNHILYQLVTTTFINCYGIITEAVG